MKYPCCKKGTKILFHLSNMTYYLSVLCIVIRSHLWLCIGLFYYSTFLLSTLNKNLFHGSKRKTLTFFHFISLMINNTLIEQLDTLDKSYTFYLCCEVEQIRKGTFCTVRTARFSNGVTLSLRTN